MASKNTWDVEFRRHVTLLNQMSSVYSGINLMLCSGSESFDSAEQYRAGPGGDTVWLDRHPWGYFEILTAKLNSDHRELKTAVLASCVASADTLMQLCDKGNVIAYTESFVAQGLIAGPGSGFTMQGISGNSMRHVSLKFSANSPERLEPPKYHSIRDIISDLNLDRADVSGFHHIATPYVATVSFQTHPLLYYSDSALAIGDTRMKGQIAVISSDEIRICSSSTLEGVLLIAPSIVVDAGVKGSFQAFASEQIQIGRNVRLTFPSTLSLLGDTLQQRVPVLWIEDSCHIEGMLVYHAGSVEPELVAQIRIGEDFNFLGHLVCYSPLLTDLQLTGRLSAERVYSYSGANRHWDRIDRMRLVKSGKKTVLVPWATSNCMSVITKVE